MDRFNTGRPSMGQNDILLTEITQLEEARSFQLAVNSYGSATDTPDASKWDLLEAIDARLRTLYEKLNISAGASDQPFSENEQQDADAWEGKKSLQDAEKALESAAEQANPRRWSGESDQGSVDMDVDSEHGGEIQAQLAMNESSFEMDLLVLKKMVEEINNTPLGELSESFRGKFYEYYSLKRDAKLSAMDTSKRLQNEVKFRMMGKFLDDCKAKIQGMVHGRNKARGCTASAAAQSRSLKFQSQSFAMEKQQAQMMMSRKVSFVEPKVANRAFVPLPNNRKARSNNTSQSRNPMTKSVPNFHDLKNENIKPSPTKQAYSYKRETPKRLRYQSPSLPGSRCQSANSSMEKSNKKLSRDIMKSISSMNELKMLRSERERSILTPLKLSRANSKTSSIGYAISVESTYTNNGGMAYLKKGHGMGGNTSKINNSAVSPVKKTLKLADERDQSPKRMDGFGRNNKKSSVVGVSVSDTQQFARWGPSPSASVSSFGPSPDRMRRLVPAPSSSAGTYDSADNEDDAKKIWQKKLFSTE